MKEGFPCSVPMGDGESFEHEDVQCQQDYNVSNFVGGCLVSLCDLYAMLDATLPGFFARLLKLRLTPW